jgi:hypothetical protein
MTTLLKNVKVTPVAASAAAGTTEVLSSVLDMQGFDGVMFIALLGDVTTASVLTLTAKGNTASSTSSPTPVAQVATAAFTADATSADDKALVVDVYDPALRYVFASLTRTAANAVVNGIIAIQYKAEFKPTTQAATVIASNMGPGVAA